MAEKSASPTPMMMMDSGARLPRTIMSMVGCTSMMAPSVMISKTWYLNSLGGSFAYVSACATAVRSTGSKQVGPLSATLARAWR